MNALKMRPAATVVVAISSSHGPGTDMQMGLVPMPPFLALPWRHDGRCVAHHDADLPCRPHLLRPPRRRSEVVGFSRQHHGYALRPGNPHGVPAAHLGHPLAQLFCPSNIRHEPHLGNHTPVGEGIHFPGQQLVDIERQQLYAMRIHAAQIRCHQRCGGDGCFMDGTPAAIRMRSQNPVSSE